LELIELTLLNERLRELWLFILSLLNSRSTVLRPLISGRIILNLGHLKMPGLGLFELGLLVRDLDIFRALEL